MDAKHWMGGVLVAAVALTVVACGDDDDAATVTTALVVATDAPATTGPALDTTEPNESIESTEPPVEATEPAIATTEPVVETTEVMPAAWEQVVPGGDCQCADGSEFSFWVRPGDPSKVVLFFQGGGACFSADTCSFTNGTFKTTTGLDDDPSGNEGLFDDGDPRNPVAGWSFVYVPYCTGDVHIGDNDHEYAPGLLVHHKGAVNAQAAIAELATRFPDADRVLVTGESAGSVPSPLYAGVVSDLLPDADIAVLADSSGAYGDNPGVNALIGDLWGTMNAVPPWPENADVTPETWSIPGLYVRAGRHDPSITFARHDFAYDETQEFFATITGSAGGDVLSAIDANEVLIESQGVPLSSWVAPGSTHTVIGSSDFYTETVNGVALVDWVTALVTDRAVPDVHCTACQGG